MLFAAKPSSRRPRKAGAKRVTAAPEPRRPPLVLTILVLVMIGLFGYGLYSINGLGDNASEPVGKTVAKAEPAPKPAAKPKAADALPEKPVEQWKYIEVLENKTVKVEVPEADDTPTRPYLMQCGSFRKQDQADSLKARIAFQGLHSQVRRSEGSNGVWFRVVLGPYDRKREAESDRHKLARAKINGCQIWFWS